MRLADIKIATRVSVGYVLIGLMLISISFYGYFSQDAVHKNYMKSNAQIEIVRKLSSLESKLLELNGTVSTYTAQNDSSSEQKVWEAFASFETILKENAVPMTQLGVKNTEEFLLAVQNYRKKIEEIVSLSEKNVIASERMRRYGEETQEKLAEMISESTLPSATFALTNLQEQLQLTITEAQKTNMPLSDYSENVQTEIDILNKEAQSVRQAEMVNVKRLKVVLAGIESFQDEIQRLIKTTGTLDEKEKETFLVGTELRTKLQEIIDFLLENSASVLYEAESKKLNRQKIFIFFAGFAGLATLLIAFFSLKGLKKPFNVLIEEILEFSQGKPKESVPYTDRKDEIGLLAQTLMTLLDAWRNPVLLASTRNYLPIGSATDDIVPPQKEETADDFVYVGDESVDAETQLRQMLLFFTNVQNAALELQAGIQVHLNACQKQVTALKEKSKLFTSEAENIPSLEEKKQNASNFSQQVQKICFSFSQSSSTLMNSAEQQEKTAEDLFQLSNHVSRFSSGLLEWIRLMTDVSNSIHKTSLQTKILALNASIEVLKLGEKAKPCNELISEIRVLSQQTTGAVDKMMENMCALQDETKTLTGVIDKLSLQAQNIKSFTPVIQTACTEMHQDSYSLSEKMPQAFNDFVDDFENISVVLNGAKDLLEITNQSIPEIENRTLAVQHYLNDFIDLLPSTDDGENLSADN